MSIDHALPFKNSILRLAAYYGHDLTKAQLEVYTDQLMRCLSPIEANKAVLAYIDDPANTFFPKPISKLIALVKDPLSSTEKSQQALALIKRAVVDRQSYWLSGYYGGKHPDTGEDVFYYVGKTESFWTWREAALDVLGELGLAMVDYFGGWQRVCETFNETQETIIGAQLLKIGEARQMIAYHRKENQLPALPAPSGGLQSAATILLNMRNIEGEE